MFATRRVRLHSIWSYICDPALHKCSASTIRSGAGVWPSQRIPAEHTLWVLADGNTRDKLLTLSAFTLLVDNWSELSSRNSGFWVFEWLCDSKKLEMQNVTNINKLPPELLERIFSMLSFSDRKTAVLVCRFLLHFSICFWFVIWNMTVSFVVMQSPKCFFTSTWFDLFHIHSKCGLLL